MTGCRDRVGEASIVRAPWVAVVPPGGGFGCRGAFEGESRGVGRDARAPSVTRRALRHLPRRGAGERGRGVLFSVTIAIVITCANWGIRFSSGT